MDEQLKLLAEEALHKAPCSIEMPAGAGKTHLLSAIACLAAEKGHRCLILTHTNAGVEAIRRRLARFGVSRTAFHVSTIDAWAFSLARPYSRIGGVTVPEAPDWSKSAEYLEGALRVARSRIGATIHSASFSYLIVDEYQDCTLNHHEFILALSQTLVRTIVLGDRLQAIFGFAGELADWEAHVVPNFPEHRIDPVPHRWATSNPELGQWLMSLRQELTSGAVLDFSSFDVLGYSFVLSQDNSHLIAAARELGAPNESVVVIDRHIPAVARIASKLNGQYRVMENIAGTFMISHLKDFPGAGEATLAFWLARFAKQCMIGLAGLDRPLLQRLENGKPVAHLMRQAIQGVVSALDAVRAEPSLSNLVAQAQKIARHGGVRLYRAEAWRDTLAAIRLAEESGAPPIECLMRVRESIRHVGRRPDTRIVSRTVLIKGLEFDHVLVANLHALNDPQNLYVALSRARKTLTVLGASPRLRLKTA